MVWNFIVKIRMDKYIGGYYEFRKIIFIKKIIITK